MITNQDLSIKYWSYPEEKIHYLDKGVINIEITNNTKSTIIIEKIKVKLNTEENLSVYHPKYSGPKFSIKSHNVHPSIAIPFIAKLTLKEGTNAYTVEITYTKNSKRTTVEDPTFQYLLLRPIRPANDHFFISHKDPDDTPVAEKMDQYLQKIGFKGFLAEIEKRPGFDIWKNKIFPGIDICVALIVLWTSNAKKNLKNILKEMKYAKKMKKKIILICQDGVSLPKAFPKYTEFVALPKNFKEKDLIDVVESIENAYRTGLYPQDVLED